MNVADLAAAYLEDYRKESKDSSAFGEVWDACRDDFEKGFSITVALVDLAQNEMELAYIGAGPVEDLLKNYGMRAFEPILAAAEDSPKVRRALAAAWIDDVKEVYPAWQMAMLRFGFKEQIGAARHRSTQT